MLKTIMDIDKEYADKIQTKCFSGDCESDHISADNILVELLRKSGYINTANTFSKVGKYYS